MKTYNKFLKFRTIEVRIIEIYDTARFKYLKIVCKLDLNNIEESEVIMILTIKASDHILTF